MIKATPRIHTVVVRFINIIKNQEQIVISQPINQNRDRLIKTNKTTYYLKMQREPKFKCEWHEDCNELHLSINKELLEKVNFDELVIGLDNGEIYKISHRLAEQLSRVRITKSQGELIANIPIQQFQKLT